MQRLFQNPSFHPIKLATLYVALFVAYILMPDSLQTVRHILSPVMLSLLLVTGVSAFWHVFQQ